mgnify:CR=1 FL=1
MTSKEYKTITDIKGPLVFLEKTEPVAYGEIVTIRLSDGSTKNGQVLDTSDDMVVVQVFEGTEGIDDASRNSSNNRTRPGIGGFFEELGGPGERRLCDTCEERQERQNQDRQENANQKRHGKQNQRQGKSVVRLRQSIVIRQTVPTHGPAAVGSLSGSRRS